MAKKSTNRQRQAGAVRSGATSKTPSSTATLVRVAKPEAEIEAANTATSAAKPTPAASSIVRDIPAKPAAKSVAKPAPKPTTPVKAATPAPLPAKPSPASRPAAPAATPPASKRQDSRVARARATQRARQAGLISPENYSYVLQDLKMVATLAASAFAVLIALTFVLERYPNLLLFVH
jgi:hypothetical protein